MSFIRNSFLPNMLFNDPSKGAGNYLNQVPGAISPYYQPYVNAGQSQIPGLENQYNGLMNNPGDIISRIGQGYQQSPGFKFQLGQGESAINNAQAAGGMAGSPQHQQQAGELANNLANQDYYQYMDKALGQYDVGLQGSQGLFNTGYGASNDMATSLANMLMSQAGLKYAGQANKNQQIGGLFGDAAGLAGLFA